MQDIRYSCSAQQHISQEKSQLPCAQFVALQDDAFSFHVPCMEAWRPRPTRLITPPRRVGGNVLVGLPSLRLQNVKHGRSGKVVENVLQEFNEETRGVEDVHRPMLTLGTTRASAFTGFFGHTWQKWTLPGPSRCLTDARGFAACGGVRKKCMNTCAQNPCPVSATDRPAEDAAGVGGCVCRGLP